MDQGAVALHATLIVLMAVTVWRLWVLGRQVRLSGDAARASRAGALGGDRAVASPLAVYPVSVHAGSAAAAVTIQKRFPDTPGGTVPTAKAVPIYMRSTPAAVKLADYVAHGNITHAMLGSAMFEVLPGEAWMVSSSSSGGGWSKPDGSTGVLVWARALSEDAAAKFPFPPLRDDSAVQLGEPGDGGYSDALVLAF
eukprot:jgi/Tetstr1/464116/TSEL_008921.t1